MKKRSLFKRAHMFLAIAMVGMITFTSCNKDDEDTNTQTITEEEAVDAIESSLAKETNGISQTVETAVMKADEEGMFNEAADVACGETYNDAYSEDYTATNYSYSYDVSRTFLMICDANAHPDVMNYSLNFSGAYETPRMSSDDESSLEWTMTGLSPSNSVVELNGAYVREGSQISKVRNMNQFQSTLTITIQNLAANKYSYEILSGTAAVTFVGISSTGNQYSYNGSLTFNGDGTATLVINGNTYIINL
ncbi:hypothetical protein [Mangrovimonas sp. ST2L15]|uniref:hypothetical protein n=1 Tax=Mangrovimonas sp. ST2L15 TaxID=1645916 RepID=UPI0006B61C17|nr:hypothetical protein [Mangrovimonas sp. ST2L15]